jgi:ABC-type uncharacterized transport system permease subunit
MTQITTYKPTFLQKLLGKNYKWWFLLQYEFKRSTLYLFNDFLWTLARIITFLLSIFVWSLSDRKDSSEIVSYLIVGNLFLSSLMPMIVWTLSQEIYDGSIINKLLVPSSVSFRYFVETIPIATKNALIIGIVILPIVFLLPNSFVPNSNLLWLIIFIFVAYLIRFFVDLLTGFITFWLTRTYGVNDFQIAIIPFLSGSLFPLSFLPSWLKIIQFQPFAFTFYHPMQIYLGKYSSLEIFYVFLGGIIWCFILYFLANFVFKMGLKRNESVGL